MARKKQPCSACTHALRGMLACLLIALTLPASAELSGPADASAISIITGARQVERQATPGASPVAHSQPIAVSPVLDGTVLGDPAWQGVTPLTGFWQVRPFEGQPASRRTEVFIGYTHDALYIGVICYDDNPAGIIVADSRRDSSLDEGDSFRVIIDTFRDRQNGFVFGTNPAGIEYDGQVTNDGVGQIGSGRDGFNLSWDTTWSVKAAISDVGWSAEMRIPFRSLRFNAGDEPVWGINFQRNIGRNNEVAYWAALSRQENLYRVSQAGALRGLNLPVQRNLKVAPYVIGQVRRGGELPQSEYGDEFGVDIKYSLTPSLTLDLTYNTDFAQVEVDDLQVNLDRFSLFFPEKRPFFLENADLFAVGSAQEVELFFSRRIGVTASGAPQPIRGGARVSGKAGDSNNLGLLHIRTESVDGAAGANDYTVARINRELPNRSAVGAIYVERKSDDSFTTAASTDYNRSYAMDGRWGIGRDGLITGYAAKSDTPGRRGADHAFSLAGQYHSAQWLNSIGFTQVGEDFNPEVGFLRRRDYQKGEFVLLRRYRPDDLGGLHELRPHVTYRGFWGNDGFYETGRLHIDNHFEWPSGLQLETGMNLVHEGVRNPFQIISGVFVPAGNYAEREAQLVFKTNQNAPLSLDVTSYIGGFFDGDRFSLAPTMRYRLGDAFSAELTWNYNRIDLPVEDGRFDVNVARLRLSYSFTPKILLQALVQHDDRTDMIATNLRFSWLQTANSGLFLVYNEVDDETIRGPAEKRREITLKYSRIFDVL